MRKLIFIIPALLFFPAQGGSSASQSKRGISQQTNVARQIDRLNQEIKHNNEILKQRLKDDAIGI